MSQTFEFIECFNCESTFTQKDSLAAFTPAEYSTQYCSLECKDEFESVALAAGQNAQNIGLIDANGEPLHDNDKRNSALNLLERFKIKITPTE